MNAIPGEPAGADRREDAVLVSAADLVRNFGHWRELATSRPIHVTSHGRRTHVLSSLRDFEARHGVAPAAAEGAVAGHDDLVALAEWIEEAVIICDSELRVVSANRVAHAICRRMPGTIRDLALTDALPEVRNTLMEIHVRRTAVGSEPSSADLPSPFTRGAWVRMQCFPLGNRNVLMFRDITDDVQRHRLADVKEALIEAMTVHGGIGYVRLSVRGGIERVDQPFCDLMGLPTDRLINVNICDLVATAQRATFRETLEAVLGGAGPRRFETGFLTNRGDVHDVSVALVQLQGAYAVEGAVLLITCVRSFLPGAQRDPSGDAADLRR